jgi:hypothetical protein
VQVAPASPDDPLDRLLRRSLGADDQAAPGVCPDPDVLAAFADGALDRGERQRVEQHASTCARCAHVLALAVSAEPAPAAAARAPAWRAWRWAVPVATAATVAGLLIVNGREQVDRASAPVARDVVASRAADGVPQSQEPAASGATESSSLSQKAAEGADAAIGRQAQAAGAVRQEAKAAQTVAPQTATQERQAPALPEAASPAEAPTVARLEQAAAADRRQAEPGRTASAAAPAQATAAPEGRLRSEAQASPPAASLADEAAARGNAREAAEQAQGFGARNDAPAPLVRSPTGTTVWRARGTTVERSTDGGTTWRLDYTAARPVLGGAAVSTDVAWFYGAAGLVLRRTAAGWPVVRSPAAGEIASIRASSAEVAFVVLADGRQFATADGGQTWGQQ